MYCNNTCTVWANTDITHVRPLRSSLSLWEQRRGETRRLLTSGFLDDRCIESIRSRCADCARTLRFLWRAERTTGNPPQLRQLEPSQEILILLHGRVVLKADVTLTIREPEGCSGANYWGAADRQDVSVSVGVGGSLTEGGGCFMDRRVTVNN